ncbi:hypothetical protein ACKVEX_01760 [Rhodocyclaceae bacterium SMB388]
MDTELANLENRLEQLIGLYESRKVEMRGLRERLAALELDNRRLKEKLGFATEKLESLLDRMPEA